MYICICASLNTMALYKHYHQHRHHHHHHHHHHHRHRRRHNAEASCYVAVLACVPQEVLIEGASDANGTVKQYQRSRQFKLRAVIYSVCGTGSLLLKTTTQWTATPVAPAPGSQATTVTFPTTSKELVVPSNTLDYGTYEIETVVVSCSQIVTFISGLLYDHALHCRHRQA